MWDGETDDWYADGYAQEREAARTAKYRVTFEVEYDPKTIDDIERWDVPFLLNQGIREQWENIAITDVKIEEVHRA